MVPIKTPVATSKRNTWVDINYAKDPGGFAFFLLPLFRGGGGDICPSP